MQWGYSSVDTVTLPIAFTSAIYAGVGCPETSYSSATRTGMLLNKGLATIGLYLHGTKGWYMVVGK